MVKVLGQKVEDTMISARQIRHEAIEKTINEIEDVGLQRTIYWGFVQLNIDQLIDIMNRGGIDGRLIIN